MEKDSGKSNGASANSKTAIQLLIEDRLLHNKILFDEKAKTLRDKTEKEIELAWEQFCIAHAGMISELKKLQDGE